MEVKQRPSGIQSVPGVLHRLRYAAKTKSFDRPLEGIVELDETYFGPQQSRQEARWQRRSLVSAAAAKQHAHREYALFDGARRAERKKQADAELAALRAEIKKLPQPKKLDKKG